MSSKTAFQTPYGEHVKTQSPAGEEIEKTYSYVINSKGAKELQPTGTRNTREEIQADLEETKIENILARVAIGDMTDFRPDGIYADATQMPNNMIDAMNAMNDLANTWRKVPQEIKAKYNNDLNQFIAASGTEAWCIDMGITQPKKPEEMKTAANVAPETKPEMPTESN